MEIWGHTQTNAKIDQTNDTTGSNSNCRYGHESKSRGKLRGYKVAMIIHLMNTVVHTTTCKCNVCTGTIKRVDLIHKTGEHYYNYLSR